MPLFPRKSSKKPKVAGGPARNISSGTNLKSSTTAAAQVPAPNLNSELGSSQPLRIIDYVPELVSPITRIYTYTKMMNDAGVDASIRTIKTPVLGADFYLEPYSEDPQDQIIAEFIEDNLMEGMSSPFTNCLEDILHFFEDGYSVVEKVFEQREWTPNLKGANNKQYTMLKKLAVRPPSTLQQITYDDNGGPTQVIQNAIKADGTTTEVKLPIDKIMIFTFNKKGGDLTGRSVLRTAYPHWYYKTHFYKLDAVQKERHGIGVPRGTLLPGAKQSDKEVLKQLLRNLRTNEESFIIQTPTITIDFAEVNARPINILSSVEHHNMMIMLNVLAAFMALGLSNTGGGGRATAATQADLFMKSLRYVAGYIASVINMYLIPELVVWNFPTTNYPQLKVRNIGETRDLQMLGAALANLYSQGAVTTDAETENWVRETFDMPAKLKSPQGDSPGGQPIPPDGTAQPQTNGAGNGAVPTGGVGNGKGTVPPGAIRPGNVGVPPQKST